MSLPTFCSRSLKRLGYCWQHGGRLPLALLALTLGLLPLACGILREPLQCRPTAQMIDPQDPLATDSYLYGIKCQETLR